jgi:hypothetical protein
MRFDGLPDDFEKFNKPHFRGAAGRGLIHPRTLTPRSRPSNSASAHAARYTEDNDEGDFEDLIELLKHEKESLTRPSLNLKRQASKPRRSLKEPGSARSNPAKTRKRQRTPSFRIAPQCHTHAQGKRLPQRVTFCRK